MNLQDEINLNALSHWFPLLQAAALPVPKTKLLTMPEACRNAVWALCYGQQRADQAAAIDSFATEIADAADNWIGWPLFLRTDHFSGKHNWERTCYVADRSKITDHIFAIAEISELCSMIGELPWDRWAVREMLPTMPVGVCDNYGGMPV